MLSREFGALIGELEKQKLEFRGAKEREQLVSMQNSQCSEHFTGYDYIKTGNRLALCGLRCCACNQSLLQGQTECS